MNLTLIVRYFSNLSLQAEARGWPLHTGFSPNHIYAKLTGLLRNITFGATIEEEGKLKN